MMLRQLLLHSLITSVPLASAFTVGGSLDAEDQHVESLGIARYLGETACEQKLKDLGFGLKKDARKYYRTDIEVEVTGECSNSNKNVIRRIAKKVLEVMDEKMTGYMDKLGTGKDRAIDARCGLMDSKVCSEYEKSTVVAKNGGILHLCYDKFPEKSPEEVKALRAQDLAEIEAIEKNFTELRAALQVEMDFMSEYEEQQELEAHLNHTKLEARIAKDMIDYRVDGKKMELDHVREINVVGKNPDVQGLEEVQKRHEKDEQEYEKRLKRLEQAHEDETRTLEAEIEEKRSILKRKREDLIKRHEADIQLALDAKIAKQEELANAEDTLSEDVVIDGDTGFVFDKLDELMRTTLTDILKKKSRLSKCWENEPVITINVSLVDTEAEALDNAKKC